MIALDTFALLKRIAGAPETFAAVETDLEKAAIAAVKKLLKSKAMSLDGLRELSRAIGPDALGFVLDHASTKNSEITALVKKLDKHWPLLASARVDTQRDHLLDLATGDVEPAEKTAPPPRPARNAAPRATAKKGGSRPPEFSKSLGAKARKVA